MHRIPASSPSSFALSCLFQSCFYERFMKKEEAVNQKGYQRSTVSSVKQDSEASHGIREDRSDVESLPRKRQSTVNRSWKIKGFKRLDLLICWLLILVLIEKEIIFVRFLSFLPFFSLLYLDLLFDQYNSLSAGPDITILFSRILWIRAQRLNAFPRDLLLAIIQHRNWVLKGMMADLCHAPAIEMMWKMAEIRDQQIQGFTVQQVRYPTINYKLVFSLMLELFYKDSRKLKQ